MKMVGFEASQGHPERWLSLLDLINHDDNPKKTRASEYGVYEDGYNACVEQVKKIAPAAKASASPSENWTV